MINIENHWVNDEFASVDFADVRLSDRFLETAHRLVERPRASIYNSCESLAQAKGAYRMFENEKVTAKEILSAHQDKTVQRINQSADVILCIQDTTFLNYSSHLMTEGLGHIGTVGSNHSQGLLMHTTFAFDPAQNLSLGIVQQDIWSRKKGPLVKNPRERKLLPIEKKESFKWIKALRESRESLGDLKKTIVTVADRECDIFEFLQEFTSSSDHYVVRAVRNRRVFTSDDESSFIWEELSLQEVAGKIEVKIPARAGKKSRQAHLEVRFCSMMIRPGQEKSHLRKSAPVRVSGILVHELRPPKGEVALEWVLLTDMKVESFEQAVEKVKWYKSRWQIEVFHKVLKSVCRVESCGLRTGDQLKKFATLCSVSAWHLLWLLQSSRETPEKSCAEILSEAEWRILASLTMDRKLKTPPTLREAVRWIAQLGGFKGRKSDGDPGAITLSRGWERLKTAVKQWEKIKRYG